MKDSNVSTDLVPSIATTVAPVFGGQLPKSLPELRPWIEQAKQAWLKRTESERTRIAYGTDLDQFLEFLGLNPQHVEHLTRVVPDDVTSWRDHLLQFGGKPDKDGTPQPASNATVGRKITALRCFFAFLQRGGYRGGNPAHPDFCKTPSVPTDGKTVAISTKECALLLQEPGSETPLEVRDTAILHMLAFLAPRVGELAALKVGDIKRDGEHMIVEWMGKGMKPRRGVVPPLAATPLNAWLDAAGIRDQRISPLFRPGQTPRGMGKDGFKSKALAVNSIQSLVRKYAARVGLDIAVTVHSLRVTATTEGDKAGASILELQKYLGHADPRTTIGYIRSQQNLDKSPAYIIRYG